MRDRVFEVRFASLLTNLAAQLRAGDLEIVRSEHDVSLDPLAPTSVSFTVQAVQADRPKQTHDTRGPLSIAQDEAAESLGPDPRKALGEPRSEDWSKVEIVPPTY